MCTARTSQISLLMQHRVWETSCLVTSYVWDKANAQSDVITKSLLQPSEFDASVESPPPLYNEEVVGEDTIATVRAIAQLTIDKVCTNQGCCCHCRN